MYYRGKTSYRGKALAAATRYVARKGASFIAKRAVNRLTNRSSSSSNSKATGAYGGPLTTQHDYKTDYRSRKWTKYKKKRMLRGKRFTYKVRNAYLRIFDYPQSVARVERYTVSVAALNCTQFQAFVNTVDGLVAPTNSYDPCHDDWRVMFREGGAAYQNAWDNATNTVSGATNPANPLVGVRGRSILFKSVIGELTVRNTGANKLIVNGYLCMCRKDVERSANPVGNAGSVISLYQEGFTRPGQVSDDAVTGANPWNAQIGPSSLEATPFLNSLFCRHYKVLKRTKFNLDPGQDFSLLVKYSKPRTLDMTNLTWRVSKKGFTYGWLFDAVGAPTGITTETGTLSVQFLKRYHIQLMPQRAIETSTLTDL